MKKTISVTNIPFHEASQWVVGSDVGGRCLVDVIIDVVALSRESPSHHGGTLNSDGPEALYATIQEKILAISCESLQELANRCLEVAFKVPAAPKNLSKATQCCI